MEQKNRMRKATQDPMALGTPEEAFYDFYKTTFPKRKMDFTFREEVKLSFMAGVAWSHVRLKFDIDSDLNELQDILELNVRP